MLATSRVAAHPCHHLSFILEIVMIVMCKQLFSFLYETKPVNRRNSYLVTPLRKRIVALALFRAEETKIAYTPFRKKCYSFATALPSSKLPSLNIEIWSSVNLLYNDLYSFSLLLASFDMCNLLIFSRISTLNGTEIDSARVCYLSS